MVLPSAVWAITAIYVVVNDGWRGFGWGDFGVMFNVVAARAAFLAVVAGATARIVGMAIGRRGTV